MLTVVETLLFQRQWPLYWTEEQRGEFASFIAEHPAAGDVVPGSGGIRKGSLGPSWLGQVWRSPGQVVLLTLYARAKTDNLSGAKLKEIRRALEE